MLVSLFQHRNKYTATVVENLQVVGRSLSKLSLAGLFTFCKNKQLKSSPGELYYLDKISTTYSRIRSKYLAVLKQT